jgi:hypothetical protein
MGMVSWWFRGNGCWTRRPRVPLKLLLPTVGIVLAAALAVASGCSMTITLSGTGVTNPHTTDSASSDATTVGQAEDKS